MARPRAATDEQIIQVAEEIAAEKGWRNVYAKAQRFPIKFKLSGPAANLGARHGPAGIVRFGGTAVLFRRLPGR